MFLRQKFALIFCLIITAIIVAVTLLFYIQDRKFIVNQINDRQKSSIRQFETVVGESILTKNDLLLINFMEILQKTNPVIVSAAFIDPAGKIKVHLDPLLIGAEDESIKKRAPSAAGPVEEESDSAVLYLVTPVSIGETFYGYVKIGYSRPEIDKTITETLSGVRKRSVWTGIGGIFTGIIIAFILAHTLVKPIKKISESAVEIARGNLAVSLDIRRKDELGLLAQEFNSMAGKLTELDELKRDFVSSVTHELRSPLGAVESYINYMFQKYSEPLKKADPAMAADWEENFTRIKSNISRLRNFINDLLDVSKIEAGKLEIAPVRADISIPVKDIVDLFRKLSEEKKITIEFIRAKNVPDAQIDPDRIKQVVVNLIGNAMKFTPENGRITVMISESAAEKRKFVRVSVRDTGMGIPREALSRIFSKFEQVKGTRDSVKGIKGTGLGLTIAKAIVELHGGRIWAESEPGRGSVFYFDLPCSDE